ncbi:MAG: hypothetical protein ACYCSQ_09730 [bacterium]
MEKHIEAGIEDDFKAKSADHLLTDLSAPKTQTALRINGNSVDADKGLATAKKKGKKDGNRRNLLDLVLDGTMSKSAKNDIKGLIFLKNDVDFRLFYVIPAASFFIEDSVNAFKKYTDIPLEIPFSIGMHFLAAYLLDMNVKVNFEGQTVRPDIWSIVLADSGGGKSYTESRYASVIEIKNKLSAGIQSSAKFIEEIAKTPHTSWTRDEVAQFIKAIKTQTYLFELKDYLLIVATNGTISRTTKKDGAIVVEDPAIAFLGLNVFETFVKTIDAEDLTDGFAQRFNYIIVKPDPARPPLSVPRYKTSEIEKTIKSAWKKMPKPRKDKTYKLSPEAIKEFDKSFSLFAENEEIKNNIPASFSRRTLFKAVKYAMIYHCILGKATKTYLDAEDISYAMRFISVNFSDIKALLEHYGLSDLEKTVRDVERLKNEYKAAGKILKTRDVISNIRAIRNVAEAKAILEISN